MQEFALSYDKRRLVAIGPTKLTYDGYWPRTLGEWPLKWDEHGGRRLVEVGPYRIHYDTMGIRPRSVGEWWLDYDIFGTRLRKIGPFKLGYDKLGNRLHTIGPMTLHYARFDYRPDRVALSGRQVHQLPESCLLALYVALYRVQTKRRSSDI